MRPSIVRTLLAVLLAVLFAIPGPLSFASLAAAQSAGMDPPYFTIDPPEKVTSTGKIEVAEVFSYACIHCAQFQEYVDAWRKKQDTKKVEFVYVPSPYNAADVLLAQGYFAAKSLGVAEKTHHAIFQAIHERGLRVQTMNDVIGLYATLGVPADKFAAAAKDFFVQTQVRRTRDLMIKYKIDSTPTLIVAGKYRITADSAGGQENMLRVADKLIAQERAQNTATSRQAPSSGK